MKRIVALLIALCMVATMVSGLTVASADEKPTLKLAITQNAMVTDYENNYFTYYLEEKLGIEIEFMMLPTDGSDTKTKIAAMAASGKDLPDVFITDNYLGNDLILAYGSDGLFAELDEYISDPEKMPNYCAIPDEDRNFMTLASTQADGHVYSLSAYEPETWNMTPFRMYINNDWLTKLNLEVPTTTEELKAVLIAFRDGDPNGNGLKDEVGIYGQSTGTYGQNIIAALMNSFVYWNNQQLNCGLALDESDYETVYAPFTSEAYRNGLRYLHDLYTEGVLSGATFTDDNNTYKQVLNADVQTVGLTSSGSLSSWPAVKTNAAFAQMKLIAPLTGSDGVNYTPFLEVWPGQEMYICAMTDKMDLALKFADEFFAHDTSLIERLGIEDAQIEKAIEYGIVDETFTGDWTRDPAKTEGHTNAYIQVGMGDKVELLITSTVWADNQNHMWKNAGPRYMSLDNFLKIFDYSSGNYYDPEDPTQLNGKCYDMYFSKKPEKLLPLLKFTVEEAEELQEAMANLGTVGTSYVHQALAEFVTGTRDIETGWEQYINELNSMGLQKLIEYSQAAYDRVK